MSLHLGTSIRCRRLLEGAVIGLLENDTPLTANSVDLGNPRAERAALVRAVGE